MGNFQLLTALQIHTSGESHGEKYVSSIAGLPANCQISAEIINQELSRDVPIPELGTARRDKNICNIFAGLSPEGRTYGTSLSFEIANDNPNPRDYRHIEKILRPGHADMTYHLRHGIYPLTGGGRASGRECITRLATGSICKQVLQQSAAGKNIDITSRLVEVAGETDIAQGIAKAKELYKQCGDTTGGIVEVCISGVPAGLGSPIGMKLNAILFYAFATIGGVKAIEIGQGIEAARMNGSAMNDPIVQDRHNSIQTKTNNAGGIIGGISTGNDIVLRLSVKPTPSMAIEQKTVNLNTMSETNISTMGRHDINFAPRVGPIAEAMAAMYILDQMISNGFINPRNILLSL